MAREKQQITYASIAAPLASSLVTQSGKVVNDIIHISMQKHADDVTPTLDMKCQATDICMTEIDATPPADPEKLQKTIDEQDEVVSEQQLHSRSDEGTATLTEKMGHGKSATQESAELRGQRKSVGKSSVAHSKENTRYGSTR
jgi:predicted RNA-binding protein with PUA domain